MHADARSRGADIQVTAVTCMRAERGAGICVHIHVPLWGAVGASSVLSPGRLRPVISNTLVIIAKERSPVLAPLSNSFSLLSMRHV